MSGSYTINLGNNYSFIEGDLPPDIFRELVERLSFRMKNYQYTRAYRERKWDGRICLFNLAYRSFLTGLLDEVLKVIPSAPVVDMRRKPAVLPENISWKDVENLELQGVKLRDYQKRAIYNAIQKTRGILDMSVGSGKTEVACGIIKLLNVPTLFVVHLRTLLYQTQQRLQKRLGCEVGVIGGGVINPSTITVASIQSLNKLYKHKKFKEYLRSIDLLIVDEAHHIPSSSYYKVLTQVDAYYRIGLSGTPLDRSDGADLFTIGVLGPVIYEVKAEKLVEEGYLAKPIIHVKVIEDDYVALAFDGETNWRNIYRLGIVECETRNRSIVALVRNQLQMRNKGIVVMVVEIDHGKILKKMAEEELGLDIPFIYGGSGSSTIKRVMRDFNEGKIPVLIASPIFDEGVDVPAISALIIACGGQSVIKTVQRMGRGMRKHQGKDSVHIFDFMDTHSEVLLRHSKKRMNTYKEMGFEVSVFSDRDIDRLLFN